MARVGPPRLGLFLASRAPRLSARPPRCAAFAAALSKASLRPPCPLLEPVRPGRKRAAPSVARVSTPVSRSLFESGADPPSAVASAADRVWDWSCASSPRERDLMVKNVMRRMELDVVSSQRAVDDSGPEREKLVATVAEFLIPRRKHHEKSVCDVFIDRIRETLLIDFRAPGTWNTYVGPWKRARSFMRACIEADGKTWCCETLRGDTRYVTACAMWCFESTTAASSVDRMMCAISLAMRANGVPVERDFYVSLVVSVAKRRRKKPVKKRRGLSFLEARKILTKWSRLASPALLMIAVAIGVGFSCLMRFSDLALVRVDGILWMGHLGCCIFLPRRKNRQMGQGSWLPLADAGGLSVVALLRLLLGVLGHKVPWEGRLPERRYVFRDVGLPPPSQRRSGHTHFRWRHDVVLGDGVRPMTGAAYDHYLSRFRDALVDCCGYSRALAKDFGCQSLRSGGDTHLFACGWDQNQRMMLGEWSTPSVEAGYLRPRMVRHLKAMRVHALAADVVERSA